MRPTGHLEGMITAAVGVAAILTGAYRPRSGERIAIVISGANITPNNLDAVRS